MDKIKVLLGIAVITLFLTTAYLVVIYTGLNERHSNLLKAYSKSVQSVQACQSDLEHEKEALLELNSQYNKLFTKYNELLDENKQLSNETATLKSELNKSQENLQNLKGEIVNVVANIKSIEESLNESFRWFESNSKLNDPSLYEVKKKCMKNLELNIPCVVYYWQAEGIFEYKKEVNDTLYSVDASMAKHSGDCEDFAFVMKALINSLEPRKLLLWEEDKGSTFDLYEEGRYSYYLDDAGEKPIYLRGKHVDVVCFLTEKNGNDYIGHCVNAVVEGNEPNITGDLFEPQDGNYIGKIGTNLGLCEDGQEECDEWINYIYLIITDKQIYLFKDGKWQSYSSMYDKLEGIKRQLFALNESS